MLHATLQPNTYAIIIGIICTKATLMLPLYQEKGVHFTFIKMLLYNNVTSFFHLLVREVYRCQTWVGKEYKPLKIGELVSTTPIGRLTAVKKNNNIITHT